MKRAIFAALLWLAMAAPVRGEFADKPHVADVAANSHLTGIAPYISIPLLDGTGGLANIGIDGDPTFTDLTANTPAFGSDEGGSLILDLNDGDLLRLPNVVSEYATGTRHWRIKLPATLPAGAETEVIAGRIGLPAATGYRLTLTSTEIVFGFSQGGTISARGVTYAAAGATGGSIVDVVMCWGTLGTRLYVNGVASPGNDPSGTETIHGGNSTGEFVGWSVGGTVFPQIELLAWNGWAAELTPSQVASLLEDPHWPIRRVPDIDTPVPQFSIDSNGLNLLMAFTAAADATTLSFTPAGDNFTATTPVYSGVDPMRLRSVLTVTDVTTVSVVTATYQYPDDGATAYNFYATSATTGKAAGQPASWTLPAISATTYRVCIIADFHGNKGATFADHIGDAGGLDNTGIGPTPQTQAEFWAALDQIQAGVVASQPNFVLSLGDDIQGGSNYCSTQGVSDALERVATNLMIPSLSAAPSARVIGNHEHTDQAAGCGEIRQESIRRMRLNPPGDAEANYEDWGTVKAGPLEIFILNEFPLTAAGDTSLANQIVALEAWAEASTSAFKAVAMHGMCCSTGFRGGFAEMDPDLRTTLIANKIDFSFNGHDHVGYAESYTTNGGTEDEHTLHVIQVPGVPFHIRNDSPTDSYSGNDHFRQSWGYVVIDLTPGGDVPITITFRETGSWTWISESGTGYVNGSQTLGLSPPLGNIVYQWPSSGSSFEGLTGLHYAPQPSSITGETGIHLGGTSVTGETGIHYGK